MNLGLQYRLLIESPLDFFMEKNILCLSLSLSLSPIPLCVCLRERE